jgi:hypothetical protein
MLFWTTQELDVKSSNRIEAEEMPFLRSVAGNNTSSRKKSEDITEEL